MIQSIQHRTSQGITVHYKDEVTEDFYLYHFQRVCSCMLAMTNDGNACVSWQFSCVRDVLNSIEN
jgi:hypothetical protein